MNAKTFFSDRPIAYHPILAKVCGSVTAALFLSQLAYWNDKGASDDGWIWKTQAEMEDETGLTRSEQETARRILKGKGILKEDLRGVPARMWYWIDWDALTNLIDAFQQSSLRESSKLDCGKVASYSEITSKSSSEKNKKGEAVEIVPEAQTEEPTQTETNFYAEYQTAFGELAQDRTIQADLQVEQVEVYPRNWIQEAFARTARAERGKGEIWRQYQRVPYALRILNDWKRAGAILPEVKPAPAPMGRAARTSSSSPYKVLND